MGLSPQTLITGKKRLSSDGGLLTVGMAIDEPRCLSRTLSVRDADVLRGTLLTEVGDSEAQFAEHCPHSSLDVTIGVSNRGSCSMFETNL